MSKANDVTLSLKVMTNKQKTKVLFAEADSDFTDILFSFLTLPLGKIAKLLDDHFSNDTRTVGSLGSLGSLTNLYKSLANIDSRHFVNEAAKQMLLSPRSSFEDVLRDLKLDICNTQPTQYFTCEECKSTEERSKNICVNYGTASCDECGGILGKEIRVSDDHGKGGNGGRGFALKSATFMISNDLRVVPSAKPLPQTLTYFGINGDIIDAELRNETFGVGKIVELLKFSLLSETPLTDLILSTILARPKSSRSDTRKSESKIPSHGIENNYSENSTNISSDTRKSQSKIPSHGNEKKDSENSKNIRSDKRKSQPKIPSHGNEEKDSENSKNISSDTRKSQPKIPSHGNEKKDTENSKNISLRVTVQISTKKLLFAQAEADFVELLFSFLTIPLGGVESLLDNNTSLKNVDNLYKSLSDSIHDKYFTTPTTKDRLMNPKLPPGYSCRKQFLPLFEENAPTFYYFESKLYYNQVKSSHLVPFLKSPKGPGNYVMEPSTYLVTDDLKVTSGMTTALTILKGIPLSDVDERVVHIGLEEALGILKASLTSTSALSSVLNNISPPTLISRGIETNEEKSRNNNKSKNIILPI